MSEYEDTLSKVALGARFTSEEWPQWFEDSDGETLEDAIRDVFNDTHMLPTPAQFEAAKASFEEEPEPKEKAPAKKTTKE